MSLYFSTCYQYLVRRAEPSLRNLVSFDFNVKWLSYWADSTEFKSKPQYQISFKLVAQFWSWNIVTCRRAVTVSACSCVMWLIAWFMDCLRTLSGLRRLHSIEWYDWEWWIEKDGKGSCCGLFEDIIVVFVWADWDKPRIISVRITNLRSEIRKQDVLNTRQGFVHLSATCGALCATCA